MNRRDFLRFSAIGSAVLLTLPSISFAAANTDRRLIFIIQRGAADGLNTVIPYADPDYAKLRGALAIDVAQAIKLDGMFALHASLAETAKLYQSGQALFVHAVASPYRDRSHFDGQNVLETGGTSAYQTKDGWMNRLLALLPKAQNEAIAFAATIPMALRGSMEVSSYAASNLPEAPDDLLMRVGQLYAQDAQLNSLWQAAMEANQMAEDVSAKQDPANLGKLAATFLNKTNGPRIAMIETSGWDTHSAQEARLSRQLKSLDQLISGLRNELGSNWQKTTVIVATEFGRTAAANGTGGTDHGTASAAMILGGDVNGGKVIADWPGLAQSNLFENRDLKPTLNLNTLIASTVSACFHIDHALLLKTLFPESSEGKLMSAIIKT
ncbi:MAG: DUF1501 domain-containing protein [Methylophilus sp.]|nr:DUF1501 domain-containing protein [Methylophilus sp.]